MRRKLLTVSVVLLALLPMAAQAAEFDVERATRAWLDTLQGPARAKSDAYFEGGYWLMLWGMLVSVLADGLLLHFGIAKAIRSFAERKSRHAFLITWMTGLAYTVLAWLLMLPWSIYVSFVREDKYGLMNQTFGEWFTDDLKELAISMLVMPLILIAIYAVIRRFPRKWWLFGSGLVVAFMAFAMLIGPVYVSPLFNDYTEMPAGPVRDRIVAMAQSRGIPAEHIYVFDASKQTKRISANVSGLGPTIRISLNDNLLNRSTPEEIAAVMGHEMGHYKLNHIWLNLVFLSVLMSLAFYLTARIAPALIARNSERWGVRDLGDPASLPVISILMSVISLATVPLTNSLIRYDESQADAFGLDVAREPDGFASVAMKLSEYRKIEPGALEEMLFYDHPSGMTRVRMAMQWKKDHVPGAQMVVPPPMPQGDLKDK